MTSSECYSSPSHLEIVLDDQTDCDSMLDDFDDQLGDPKTSTTRGEHNTSRRRQSIHKNPKPHRLIEKRRRDRMNSSLDALLELIPHKKPTNQRRIEKTEVVEMAINYVRSLVSSIQKSAESLGIDKQAIVKLNAYRAGYHNCLCDTLDHLEKQSTDHRTLSDCARFGDEKETELNDLTALPERKAHSQRRPRSSHSGCGTSQSEEHMYTQSDGRSRRDHDNILQFSIDAERTQAEQTKVPIFVLHPSGTHYIPMRIDSSVVSHAFHKQPDQSRSSSANEQFHCHPVSIPVNFSPTPTVSEPYELDIQNINVIAARHQTSVRPR